MSVQQIADGQVHPEVPINENNAALGQSFLWTHDVTADSGLTVGLNGGNFNANAVSDGTVACTDNATNYIVANRSTRVVSVATTTTNWNNTVTYGRIARAVFASGVLTFYDERNSGGGIFDFGAGGGAVLADGDYGDIVVSGSGTGINIDSTVLTTFGRTLTTAANSAAGRTALGLGTVAVLASDTDGTLAANSDSNVPTQKAVKTYADNLVTGLSWKQAVRAATTVNGTLATAYANGQAVDGVTLATGDRILLKNQTTGAENGLYVVAASGAPARSTDADAGAELVNATVFVSEGTTNGDTQWTCSTNAPITLGSTSLAFSQVAGAGTYSADESTIHLSGNQFSLKAGAVAIDTHAATGKTTPVDADEFPIVDSAASNALKKLTWANLKATMFAAWGALIATATGKTTPVDADAFAMMDSAASNATKGLTWANLKATLKTYFDGIYGTGSGSVTSVSVVTANGVSGSVANATTTPAITLTLGAITPSTVNGMTITANSGAFHVANAKAFDVVKSLTLDGTDGTTMTFPSTSGTVATADSTTTFTGKTFDTAGSGNVFKINGTGITDKTGTGKAVLDTSPTLTTPALGTPSALVLTNATGATGANFGTQSANTVWAGPGSGSAANPTFRALVAADLPAASAIASPAFASTLTLDLSTIKDGGIFRVTLTGAITLQLSNGTDGQKFVIELTQDGTGTRLVTLGGSYFKFGTDITSFTATTTASKKDRIGCIATGATTADVLAVQHGY